MQAIVQHVGEPWVWGVVLLSTRLAALFLVAPLFQAMAVPTMVRVLLTWALAVAIAMPLAPAVPAPAGIAPMIVLLALQAAIGAALGLAVLFALSAFNIAGRLLDLQSGFALAQVLDPVTKRQAPVLTSLLGVLAVVLFLAADGHHGMLRAVAWSTTAMPLGQSMGFAETLPALLESGSAMFAAALALAGPALACMLLVEFGLGVLARSMPQANMLLVALPVKVGACVLALALMAPSLGASAQRAFAVMLQGWTAQAQALPAPPKERR